MRELEAAIDLFAYTSYVYMKKWVDDEQIVRVPVIVTGLTHLLMSNYLEHNTCLPSKEKGKKAMIFLELKHRERSRADW